MDYVKTAPEDLFKREDSGSTTPIPEQSTMDQDKPTFHHQEPKRLRRSTPYVHPSYYARRLDARNRTRRAHEEAETLADLLSSLGESTPSPSLSFT